MAVSSSAIPDAQHRWRCGGCGNLTRFDVVREARTREFWHVDLSGEPSIEETETVNERIVSVTCRWCGRDDAIEVVLRPASSAEPATAASQRDTGAAGP